MCYVLAAEESLKDNLHNKVLKKIAECGKMIED